MEKNKITTLKLRKDSKDRLNKLKEYFRESYEEIIEKILEILNLCKASPEKAKSLLGRIEAKRQKIKESGQYSEKELKEKLNL